MPAHSHELRRGLPRVSGGEPWPPAGAVPEHALALIAGAAADSGAATTGPAPVVAQAEPGGAAAVGTAPADVTVDAASAVQEPAAVSVSEGSAVSEGLAASEVAPTPAAGAPTVRRVRRGLPRVPGGESWPPVGEVEVASAAAAVSVEPMAVPAVPAVVAPEAPAVAEAVAPVTASGAAEVTEVSVPAAQAAPAAGSHALRRGLPRVPGGEPWPPAGEVEVGGAVPSVSASSGVASTSVSSTSVSSTPAPDVEASAAEEDAPAAAPSRGAAASPAASAVSAAREVVGVSETPLRRGLPRAPGGEAWPPAGFAPLFAEPVAAGAAASIGPAASADPAAPADSGAPAEQPASIVESPVADSPAAVTPAAEPAATGPAPATEAKHAPAPAPAAAAPAPAPATAPTPVAAEPAPVAPAPAPKPARPKREPVVIGSKTLAQWVRLGVLGVVGLVVAAGIIVLAARGVTTLPGVPGFMAEYPGEYALPYFVEEGFPAWARWTHYLNFFFMVLIVRTGLLVRHQQKPDAFYMPKRGGKKVSIYLWLHTSLDVLWLANGVVFVVLLFATGHWARIVPTSWEVFPNAASALLQYLTLEWPAENGWVNYNSLQQLMYFLVVFVAAPLAAITGVRMSEWWPKDAERLNRLYPAPVARAVHFPTMLFFVLFVIVHVFLVFATGALQNLNHMFHGTGHDPSWVGFWWFAAGFVVCAGAVFAARPLVLAPIAGVTGKITNR
ncbi:MAG: cytochrome b/b6 domain-containing protein [Leucobacter sp.]